jgi:hypothetical protein
MSRQGDKMADLRKYRRIPYDSIVMYKTPFINADDQIKLVETETPAAGVDLSEAGMKFLSIQKLPVDTALTVFLSIGKIMPLMIQARVAWTGDSNIPGSYSTGIEFQGMDLETQDSLKNFIDDIT